MYICDFLCTITKPRREWQRIQISSRGNTLFHEWSLHTQLTEHFWTRQTNVRLNSKTMHLSYVWRVKSWRDIYHFKWKVVYDTINQICELVKFYVLFETSVQNILLYIKTVHHGVKSLRIKTICQILRWHFYVNWMVQWTRKYLLIILQWCLVNKVILVWL